MIENNRSTPRFIQGYDQEEFTYVRGVSPGRVIVSRELFLDQLLQPPGNALVWGLGEVSSLEVADYLGLSLHTPLYATQLNLPVFPSLPPGYFVAGALPADVALVAASPQGPIVLFRRLPPGTVVAYQPLADGRVLNECLVVPPPSAEFFAAPGSLPPPSPVQPATVPPAPAPAAGTGSHVVYDASGKVNGVVVISPDGRQEFVPTQ